MVLAGDWQRVARINLEYGFGDISFPAIFQRPSFGSGHGGGCAGEWQRRQAEQQQALDACAIASEVNEELLARMPDRDDARGERLQRVLHLTYLFPARDQKQAAAACLMGYSTYRRQLAQARDALVAELWRREQAHR